MLLTVANPQSWNIFKASLSDIGKHHWAGSISIIVLGKGNYKWKKGFPPQHKDYLMRVSEDFTLQFTWKWKHFISTLVRERFISKQAGQTNEGEFPIQYITLKRIL